MPNAAKQWERWAREDPYYAVRTDDAFRHDALDAAALERFYASGEDHVQRLENRVTIRGRALDFGCGTGRVLIPLAQRCEHVTGVDVSPSMLAECRRACDQHGVSNVTLTEAVPAGPFDFVHSAAVLQHIPIRRGYKLILEMLSALAPDGCGAINITVGGRRATRLFYWTLKRVPLARNVWNVLRGRRWSYPTMQMNSYGLDRVLAILADQGITTTKIEYAPAPARTDLHSVLIFFRR